MSHADKLEIILVFINFGVWLIFAVLVGRR